MDTQTYEIIGRHLSFLSPAQIQSLEKYELLLKQENRKVNLISRKDIEHIFPHHILHALSLTLFFSFEKGQSILDIGSGGGIPAVPLSIIFPNSHFTLVDSIGKKTKILEYFIQELKISNVIIIHDRVENLKLKYDTIMARAVAPLRELIRYSLPLIQKKSAYASRGLLFFKGGNIEDEITQTQMYFTKHHIGKYLGTLGYFREKYLLHSTHN